MPNTSTDCRTADGDAVGLIDGLITACRVLRARDLTAPAVRAALADLATDADLAALLREAQAPAESWYAAHSAQLQGLANQLRAMHDALSLVVDRVADLETRMHPQAPALIKPTLPWGS